VKKEPEPEAVTALPPVPPAPVLPPPGRRTIVQPASPIGFPKWIFVGLAGVLLLILGLNLRRKPEAPRLPPSVERVPPPASAPPTVSRPAPEKQASRTGPSGPSGQEARSTGTASRIAPPGQETRPTLTEAARAAKPPGLEAKPVNAGGKAMWRVIAFTYGSHDLAAKKAKQVNQRWPDLHASVFSPKDRRGYYLVALGGRMKREEALRLQKRAHTAGLPRDTYVQNYAE
jgi:hypothetical protein